MKELTEADREAYAAATHAAHITERPRVRKPKGLGWFALGVTRLPNEDWDMYGWTHDATMTRAISSLNPMRLPATGRTGLTWLVSVTRITEDGGADRPSEAQARLVRCAFGMLDAEEDNHHPGNSRHFFLPVNPAERVPCECKAGETQVVEPDGYRWSKDEAGPCAGCDLARTMAEAGQTPRPCPEHGASASRQRGQRVLAALGLSFAALTIGVGLPRPRR